MGALLIFLLSKFELIKLFFILINNFQKKKKTITFDYLHFFVLFKYFSLKIFNYPKRETLFKGKKKNEEKTVSVSYNLLLQISRSIIAQSWFRLRIDKPIHVNFRKFYTNLK